MTNLKPCPFLVRMCSMDGQIIGYTCKGECANCPAKDAKGWKIKRLKMALKQIAEIANRRGHLSVATWQKDAWYELAKIVKEALANAPDTNVGKMEE